MGMMQATRLDAYNLIHEGVLALAAAERVGMRVDVEYCEKKKEHLTRKVEWLEKRFLETALAQEWKRIFPTDFNIGSDTQLRHLLYDVMGKIPPKTTESGLGGTDEEALTQLGDSSLLSLIQMKKLRKIRDTYLDGFLREQVDGVIHPFYNLHTARTYRSSCESPNFQNIPKRDEEAMKICRRAIYARKGHQLLEVDFKGLEVSIAACYHKDPTMFAYLTDTRNDMHRDVAMQIFFLDEFNKALPEHKKLRNATKNGFIFPQFYGDYYKNNAHSLAVQWGKLGTGAWKKGQGIPMPGGSSLATHMIEHGIKSFTAFEKHLQIMETDFWGKRFPVYNKWREDWFAAYQKNGFFQMHTGFECRGVFRRNEVINYPVQGAAFHCLLWCFIQIHKQFTERKMRTCLIGQIHDALIVDVHPDELNQVLELIHKVTTEDLPNHWKWIIVPLEVEADLCPVDAPWSEKRGIKIQ
jgi:DNA polymerase-1